MTAVPKTRTALEAHTQRLCERARRFEDDADPYLRGLVATEVYRNEPGLHVVRKRAEVTARTRETLQPVVLPEERIVGAAYRRFRVHPDVGDSDAWRIRVLYPDRHGYDPPWPLPDQVREQLEWWSGRDVGLWGRNAARSRNRWLSRYALAGPHGLADITNSLLAVQRLVYQERRLSLEELRDILRSDWEGHERLRQLVLNRLPRFGQDNPAINRLARQEAAHYARCFRGQSTGYGGRFWPMIFGVATSFMASRNPKTGATPGGRKAGEALAISLQPSPAGPRGAPSELLRCIGAIDCSDFPGGISNVQEFDPGPFTGKCGLDTLEELVRGYFGMGGIELSLNFVSVQKLGDAREHPDRHRNLTVRLFGLSAYFVDLSEQMQESIIERVAGVERGT